MKIMLYEVFCTRRRYFTERESVRIAFEIVCVSVFIAFAVLAITGSFAQ
jgi:hypothetical protein